MGLRQKLIDAKVDALQESAQESIEVDTGPNSYIYLEADKIAKAILETLSEADLTITKLKAPVIVERLKIPEQNVNIELSTLLADKVPILKVLRTIGSPIPGIDSLIDKLETQIEKAITPILEGGAKMAGFDLNRDEGGLESIGYVYIGEDPDSIEEFDVEDEEGQSEHTTVHLSADDIEDLL